MNAPSGLSVKGLPKIRVSMARIRPGPPHRDSDEALARSSVFAAETSIEWGSVQTAPRADVPLLWQLQHGAPQRQYDYRNWLRHAKRDSCGALVPKIRRAEDYLAGHRRREATFA